MNEQIYDALLKHNQIERAKHKPKSLFRSSQLHLCERRLVYGLLGYEVNVEEHGSGYLALNIGTAVHEVIQTALVNDQIITNCEEEVSWPELNFNGHFDGECHINKNNEILKLDKKKPNAIFELKTINAQGFVKLYWNKSAKKEHIQQVNMYMGLKGYKKAAIVYLNKNGMVPYDTQMMHKWPKQVDQKIQTFVVDFDEQLWQQTEQKLVRLNENYTANKDLPQEEHLLPNKLPSGAYECNYCEFKSICRTGRKKVV